MIFSTQSKDRASWRRGSEVGFGADAGFDELEGATDSIAVSVFAEVLVEFDQYKSDYETGLLVSGVLLGS